MGRDGTGSPLSCSPAPEWGILSHWGQWVPPPAPREEVDRCALLSSAPLLSLFLAHTRFVSVFPSVSPGHNVAIKHLLSCSLVFPVCVCSLPLPFHFSFCSFLIRFLCCNPTLPVGQSEQGHEGPFGDDGYVLCLDLVTVSQV